MDRKSALDREKAVSFKQRLNQLKADTKPRWGTMSVPEMLAHVDELIRISLGDRPVRDESNRVLRLLLRPVILSSIPFPKGKAKAPASLLPQPEGDLEALKRRLLERIDQFVDAFESAPGRRVTNPVLGPLDLSQWAVIHGKHLRHHLEQFGA